MVTILWIGNEPHLHMLSDLCYNLSRFTNFSLTEVTHFVFFVWFALHVSHLHVKQREIAYFVKITLIRLNERTNIKILEQRHKGSWFCLDLKTI